MTYLVFGLGALLSIAGALAIYFGYDIVEVERGWTSVIAGATALSGGIVTLALAAVLRSLNRLRATLSSVKATPEPTAHEAAEAAPAIEAPAALPEMDGIEPSPFSFDFAPPAASVPIDPPTPPAASAPIDSPRLAARPPLRTTENRAPPLRDAAPIMPLENRAEEASSDAQPSEVAPSLEAALPIETAPTPETAPATQAEAGANSSVMAMGHWIERALAGVEEVEPAEHRSSGTPVPTLGAALPEPQLDTRMSETSQLDIKTDDAPLASPHTTPEALEPVPSPSIIGQYESEGTTYVMFADGSIEARSETGIYRFGSMAELKAFVESGG